MLNVVIVWQEVAGFYLLIKELLNLFYMLGRRGQAFCLAHSWSLVSVKFFSSFPQMSVCY